MNRPPNSQSPYPPRYPQTASGPPQPEWQAAPASQNRPGWYNQRLQPTAPVANHAPYYNSNFPGPTPGTTQSPVSPPQSHLNPSVPNTAAWGVRYNQYQHHGDGQEPKPALPPRPASGGGYRAYYSRPSQEANPAQWSEPSAGLNQAGRPQWQHLGHDNQQPQAVVPPPPPPRPLEYQLQSQQYAQNLPQPQYSHHPPSHHYEPDVQPPYHSASGSVVDYDYRTHQPNTIAPGGAPAANPIHYHQQPVSPEEHPNPYWPAAHQTPTRAPGGQSLDSHPPTSIESQIQRQSSSASAFGSGGLSDWEHFTPVAEHVEESNLAGGPAFTNDQDYQSPRPKPATEQLLPDTTLNESNIDAHQTPWRPRSRESAAEQIPMPTIGPSNNIAAAPAPLNVSRASRNYSDSRTTTSMPEGEVSKSLKDGLQRSGTIDGVIQAWNKPLTGRRSPRREESSSKLSSRHSSVSASGKTEPRRSSVEATKASMVTSQILPRAVQTKAADADALGDLEPEYRASLGRYVKMLRQECSAALEEDKFQIFSAFMRKELRLRSVLYGIDGHDLDGKSAAGSKTERVPFTANPPQNTERLPRAERASSISRPTVTSAGGIVQQHTNTTPQHVATPQRAATPQRSATPNPTLRSESPKLGISTSLGSHDDSFVVVNQGGEEEEEYSPGGRPKLSRPNAAITSGKISIVTEPTATANLAVLSHMNPSPIDNAPMVLEDYMTGAESPGRNAPMVVEPQDPPISSDAAPTTKQRPLSGPVNFEPPRPVYTPFRYVESVQGSYPKSTIGQPAYQAYSALRHQNVDSGRVLAQVTPTVNVSRPERTTASPLSNRREHEETFLGLIREQSRAYRNGRPTISSALNQRPATPSGLLVSNPKPEAILAIRAAVPKVLPVEDYQPPKISSIHKEIANITDDFGFIHEAVVRWDRSNKVIRDTHERERQARQDESENRIDSLFNDKEIGYSDIAALEADFKLAEAKTKYAEDQNELESFTSQVFEPLSNSLQQEILRLNAQYVLAVDLLDLKSDSASHYATASDERVRTSQAMQLVLLLFNKIQIRYQKLAEAHFERERRRKKLELTILYANRDTAGIKRLEEEFLAAEKLQVLREAQEKDTRANKLMDTFDRATVRALGDNQTYVDDLSVKLRKLDTIVGKEGKEPSPANFEPDGLRDTLLLAENTLDFIAVDSKTILQTSNDADKILNDADYALSVANAKMTSTAEQTYRKLGEEKSKEDGKIREDADVRMESIAKGPTDAISIINGIVARIGDDPQQQERVQKALEEAKKRNASKSG